MYQELPRPGRQIYPDTGRSEGNFLPTITLRSRANVGCEKDSDRRHRGAITGYARLAGFEIVGEYYDAAIWGADLLRVDPGLPRCSSASTAMAFAWCLSREEAPREEDTRGPRTARAGRRVIVSKVVHKRFPEAVVMPKRLYRADPKSGERRIARDRRGASQGRPRQGEPVSEHGQGPLAGTI